jgi:predicted MFS family arabinose efflux permease
LADSYRLGGVLALVLAVYAWTLPHTPPARRGRSWLAPLEALHLFRERSFGIYALCAVTVCITLTFHQQATPLLLEQLDVPRPWIPPALTIAQSMEVLGLGLLPLLLDRLGMRLTMLLGLSAWALELVVILLGRANWLVVGSLGLYGLCISCYLCAGQVFANQRASRDFRASAQGLLTFLNGLGLLIGNVLVGWVREMAGGDLRVTFAAAAVLAVPLVGIFFVGFGERAEQEEPTEVAPVEAAA